MIEEVNAVCPCCWEDITLIVDLSAGSQRYVEDCEVCCRPMLVILDVDESGGYCVNVESDLG